MRTSSLIFYFLSFFLIFRPTKGIGDKPQLPSYSLSWLEDKNTFRAGDIATIKIKPVDFSLNDSIFNHNNYAMNFSVTVNGKKGNSSYVSGVLPYTDGDVVYWNISFVPIRVGNYGVVITEEYSGIMDSSLHYSAIAGHIHPSACIVSWSNSDQEFVAGKSAYISIFPKDAFGNDVSWADEPPRDYFMLAASFQNGSAASIVDVRYNGWDELSYIGMEFTPVSAGSLLLHAFGDNSTLRGTPLPFVVRPGALNITNSVGKWKYGTSSLQIFSKLEFFIYQRDQFGNTVPELHTFDAEVVEKSTNLSIPVADLTFTEVEHGIQLASFVASEPGEFILSICSAKLSQCLTNTPYEFTIFTGYCDGSKSIVNGSGLSGSTAGSVLSYFTVYLEDTYYNPSPVELKSLHVKIVSLDGLYELHPVIVPFGGFEEGGRTSNIYDGYKSTPPAQPVPSNSTSIVNSTVQASDFNITYTPEKSGDYQIWVFCGNIPLNNGRPYPMTVQPGRVNTSLSRVTNFVPRVERFMRNEITVQLMDSFSNPITSLKKKLSIHIEPTNTSGISTWPFVEIEESYVGYYLARDIGSYNICILFEDKHLSPCPFEVNAFDKNYFPVAFNDSVSVWEDESVAFDVLSNDYVSDGLPTILEFSKPVHGSLLQYGRVFRYTPYEGFFGNDIFTYTISDINKNLDTGVVTISVLCKPPQFVSVPVRLHVYEDIMSPKFGGFPGFEIEYSNVTENVSVIITAKFGVVFPAPSTMTLWQPLTGRFEVKKGEGAGHDLTITGGVDFVNSALKLIQYISNNEFYGNDAISLYSTNKNGIQDAHVPLFVEPINDPPIIHAPEFIVLENHHQSRVSLQLFDKNRDDFEFYVADPDLYSFEGNKSQFMVIFSLEVNNGIISTSLPVHLLSTAELKIKGSSQWQPLQTFVSIANHFILKGRGIRFRGTIRDCNNAIQRIFYEGGDDDSILTIRVNDLGNFGCSYECIDTISFPLSTSVSIKLVKRKPIGQSVALLLGWAIVFEISMMILLGTVLLFFICKCMNVLHKERQDRNDSAKHFKVQTQPDSTVDNVAIASTTDCVSNAKSFRLQNQPAHFRQRSGRVYKNGDHQNQSSIQQFLPLSVEN